MLSGIAEAEAPVFVAQSTDSVLEPSVAPPKPLHKTQNATTLKRNCEEYRDIISQYEWDVETAMAVCSCESSGNANVVNDNPKTGDMSIGLMQINIIGSLAKERPSKEWLLVPENNILYSFELYKVSGFNPWSCFHKLDL